MTTHPHDELHALRTRAYGPNADIHNDPAALQRLAELEGSLVTMVTPVTDVPRPDATGRTDAAASVIESAPGPAAVSDVADEEAGEPPIGGRRERRERRRTKRLVAWWVASLLVAVMVAVSVTAFVSRRVQADPREVAVLGVDLGYSLPSLFGADEADSRAFGSFYGMRVMASKVGWMGDAVGECISVFDESEVVITSDSVSGPVYTSCGAGDFPAAMEIYVMDSMPAELRAEFPVGTALQFVLDGAEVIVLSDLQR